MKKILFGLIATVLFSGMSFGQKMSADAEKKLISSQMVALVNVSKAFYVRGQSYDDFIQVMMIPSPTFPSQDLLFKKVHSYLTNNTAECDIMKADNSILLTFATDLSKNPPNQSTLEKAHSNPPKKWWMIAINWIVNGVATIITTQNGLPPMPPIDLFPGNAP